MQKWLQEKQTKSLLTFVWNLQMADRAVQLRTRQTSSLLIGLLVGIITHSITPSPQNSTKIALLLPNGHKNWYPVKEWNTLGSVTIISIHHMVNAIVFELLRWNFLTKLCRLVVLGEKIGFWEFRWPWPWRSGSRSCQSWDFWRSISETKGDIKIPSSQSFFPTQVWVNQAIKSTLLWLGVLTARDLLRIDLFTRCQKLETMRLAFFKINTL